MINVNDEIKQAYDKSTTQIDKILVNGNEYRISNVEYYDDVYNEGNIFGTAISRCLEFEIQNTIDLEKTEIEYFTGILINTTIQWISLGKFIIQSVEPNDTTQINKVTAMDYMIKSNTIYTSNLDYSSGKITLLRVLQEACDNSNLELATFDFANKDFIVDSNQFDEGTLNRQVIQAIAQLSGTVAKIRTDNKLYLINPNNDLEVSKIFNLNNYKEAEIKRNTHPLNVVSLGMADVEGENITLRDEESVIKNGENILVINDNPFAYTQAKREQLITALFDAVKGFEYTSYYFECQGLPYSETLDKIQFKDIEGNTYNSYIFRFNYKSPNGLESSIEAPSITKATVNYQNVPSALDIAKRAELKVDKANQTITFIVEEQTTQSNRITNVEKETNTVASNLNTFINETYSNDISNLQDQIDGAIQFWNGEEIPTLSNYPASEWTTEEQRNNHRADIYTVIQDIDGEMKQGKSYRFDKVGTTWQWVELTDNELSAVQALANSKAKVYVNTPTVPYNVGDLWLKDKELYECIKSKDATGSYSASDWVKATKYTDDTKANEVDNKLTTTNEKVATIELNLDSVTTRVSSTETKVTQVETTANTAKSTADTAKNTADTAKNTAESAKSTADTANTNSNTAISTANTAKTNSETAVNTANTANTNASNAVSTANTASTNASNALSTANTAKSTADTANAKANDVDNKLTTTNKKVSEIEVNVNGITERVEANETGIQENSESINQIENKILLTDTFERQKDFQIDAAENILTDVKVYGELEQETRSGKNLLNVPSSFQVTTYKTVTINLPIGDYVITWDNLSSDGTDRGMLLQFYYEDDETLSKYISPSYTSKTVNFTTTKIVKNVKIYSQTTYNNSVGITTTFTKLMISTNGGEYEEYGAMPSPDYPSKISVTGDNINYFDISKVVNTNSSIDMKIEGNIITMTAIGTTGAQAVIFDTEALDPAETYRFSCKAKRLVDMQGAYRQLHIARYYSDDGKTYTWVENMDVMAPSVENQEYALYGTMTGHKYYRILLYNYAGNPAPIGEKSQYYDIKLEKQRPTLQTNWTPYKQGSVDYVTSSKNILPSKNVTKTIRGLTFTKNSDGSITVNGTATAYTVYNINENSNGNQANVKLKDNTRYYMSSGVTGSYSTYFMQGFFKKNQGDAYTYTSIDKASFMTGTNSNFGAYIVVRANTTVNNVTFYPQLETDGYTEYEPHKEYNETITLPENEFMGKIDTYEDYIEGNILHKRIGKFILDGTENWKIARNANSILYFFYPLNEKVLIRNSKCNYLKEDLNLYYSDGSISIYNIGSNLQNINILLNDTTINTVDLFKNYLAEQYANGTPVEIYYVLAEEYTRQIDKYTLPTMKGINNISVSAPLSATYYTNVDINSALTSKAEYAEQVIKVDEISTRVSSTETTVANQSADISNINDNIGSLNNSVNANQQEITVIKEDYTDLKQTVDGFDFTVVDKIQQQIANGEITSNVVKTTTVAIDADGIKVAKSGSEMQSLLDNEGFYVNKGNIDKTETKNNILTVDKDGVVTENLYVRTYLTAGYHRTEGYIENGKKRTGVFYQGGVND